ncbi:hypothetical protein PYW07_004139 [Mythimna separata]|uniref:Uncharacterized protein n=1 Tax=Mythimna separata TaxID=271217 RepID=A0AAD7YQH0_MYTSE|nr:hypothetical protein PYW07_004139 [Mythimna separata]
MDVIPERANMEYINPKYIYPDAKVTVRRYGRKSRYYINISGTTKHSWNNNVTLTLGISQLLHNEYRPSFVEIKNRLCELINNEPFVGGALRNIGLVCPMRAGYQNLMNLTAPTEHFPYVFPFEHGRLEISLNVTDTREQMILFYVVVSFKQKLKGK